jgi:putative spermidine/putrescine transport system substrate-binding protein
MQLIDFTLTPDRQANLAELVPYGPVNPKAKPKLDELGMQYLPTTPERQATAILTDTQWWADNFEDALGRYTEWTVG